MTQRHIGTLLDRKAINDINDNFTELYGEYVGSGMDAAEAREMAEQAVADALFAKSTAVEAKDTADLTREELIAIIREQTEGGDVVPEVVQARGTHSTVGERLNSISQDLAHNTSFVTNRTFNNQIMDRGVNGAAVFIDDDLKPHLRSTIIPVVDRLVAPLTCAVPTNRIDTNKSLTLEEMKELEKKGFNYASHTMDHVDLTTLSESEVERQLKGSRDRLRELGFNTYDTSIVYPHGNTNETVRRIARKYFRSGVIDHTSITNKSPIDTYGLGRVYLNYSDGTHDIPNVKAKMDQAKQNGELIIVGLHASFEGFDAEWLIEVMEYAKSIGLELPTLDEALNKFGNIIEVGSGHEEIKVGFNGKGNLKDYLASPTISNVITIDTPLHDFGQGKTDTYFYVGHQNAAGFPDDSGILETLRLGNNWGYQKFRPNRKNEVFYRFWDYASGNWSGFVSLINKSNYIADGLLSRQINIDTPLTFFNRGKTVTHYYTNEPGVEGFPSNSGILETFRSDSDYGYQKFYPALKYDVFYRYWDYGAGKWSEFQSLVNNYSSGRGSFKNGWTGTFNYTSFGNGLKHLRGSATASGVARGHVIADIPTTNSSNYTIFDAFNITQSRKVAFYVNAEGSLVLMDDTYLSEGDEVYLNTVYR